MHGDPQRFDLRKWLDMRMGLVTEFVGEPKQLIDPVENCSSTARIVGGECS